MKIVLSNLPKGTDENDVEDLIKDYGKVVSIEILGDKESDNLESLVTLSETDRVVVDKVVEKLNGTNWKGAKLGARALVFQENDDAS